MINKFVRTQDDFWPLMKLSDHTMPGQSYSLVRPQKSPRFRRTDPSALRQALLLIIFGALVGALLIVAFERYRMSLRDWLLSEPGELAYRVRLVFFLSAVVLFTSLVAFAVYLWSLGVKVLHARQFPPPGFRVIHDTPVIGGQAAVFRGHGLKVLAVCLGVASALLYLLFCSARLAAKRRGVFLVTFL